MSKVYTVKSGDTLSGIAKKYYDNGDYEHYMVIFNANKSILTNPDQIKPGQNLTIPNISDNEEVYTVKSGDTLSGIAKKYYDNGDYEHYMAIFNANKDILTNPDQIKPGQNLTIPNL